MNDDAHPSDGSESRDHDAVEAELHDIADFELSKRRGPLDQGPGGPEMPRDDDGEPWSNL